MAAVAWLVVGCAVAGCAVLGWAVVGPAAVLARWAPGWEGWDPAVPELPLWVELPVSAA